MRPIASWSRAFPTVPRCDRPRAEVSSAWADHPGGLAQGPDEKYGRFGFVAGLAGRNVAPAAAVSVNVSILAESARRVGTAWPAAVSREECGDGKAARKIRRRLRGTRRYCAAQQVEIPRIASADAPDSSVHRAHRTTHPAQSNRRLNSLTIRKQCCRHRLAAGNSRAWARGWGAPSEMGFGEALRATVDLWSGIR